jgi:hypothetical protein
VQGDACQIRRSGEELLPGSRPSAGENSGDVSSLDVLLVAGGLALIVAGAVSIIRRSVPLGIGLVVLGILVAPGGLALFGD